MANGRSRTVSRHRSQSRVSASNASRLRPASMDSMRATPAGSRAATSLGGAATIATASYVGARPSRRARTKDAGSSPGSSRGANRPGVGRAPRIPIHAERPPVVSVEIPSREIPAPPDHRDAVRLDEPFAGARIRARVREPQPLMARGRPGDHDEKLGVDRRWLPRDRRGRRGQGRDPATQASGQHLLELREGPDRGAVGIDAVRDRETQRDRHRHRLVVFEEERRHRGPADEPVPADAAKRGFDGVAEVPQPLDVPAHGAARDLESFRERRPRPLATVLEQREQPEEPACGLCHEAYGNPYRGPKWSSLGSRLVVRPA